MIEVAGVYRYPLTGARAEVLSAATVGPSGIEGDRNLVLYDALADDVVMPRVSQLKIRALAKVACNYGDRFVEYCLPNYGNFYVDSKSHGDEVVVAEFGDEVPCHDMGDLHANRLQRQLGHEGIRLAKKTEEWLTGGTVRPSERHNRPIHIVSAVTLRELQNRARGMGINNTFQADRFRPNIVIDGSLVAFEENEWQGSRIIIGDVAYFIQEPTPRCPVPGFDQRTGQSMKDIPKLYRGMPQNEEGTALMGVYAYPVMEVGDSAGLAVGMSVAA